MKPSFITNFVRASLLVSAGAVAQPIQVHDVGPLPGDIAIAPATNSQLEVSAARGDQSTLVVWSDYRGTSSGSQTNQSDGDIFGVRIDAAGQPQDPMPFQIAGGMGLQNRPLVAWNGQNWLVVYISQDPVAGYFEYRVRAVRVSPMGQILDATPITFPPSPFSPDTIGLNVSGLGGQWLVTRCIYHNDGYGTFLAGQRISNGGVLLDSVPVMLNDWVYGATSALVSGGEYLVVGPDWNNSSIIKARRVNANAQPLAASFDLPAGTNSIAASGSGYYVTWIANFTDLVGSRVTSAGVLTTPTGTPLVPGFAGELQSTHDGVNWWLAWTAGGTARAARISPSGALLDPGGVALPIVVTGNINSLYTPRLTPLPGGGIHFLWADYRGTLGSDGNVFVVPIGATNSAGEERCLSIGTPSQRSPTVCRGAGDSAAVIFTSEAANDDRVLVHLLSGAGTPVTPEPIEVYRGSSVGRAGIAFNGSIYLCVFDTGTTVKARRMAPDGSFIDAAPFDLFTGFNPAVGALGDNFLVAAAKYGSNPQIINLVGMRIDGPAGVPIDAAPMVLGGSYVSGLPRVRTDGVDWVVTAHSMWTHDSSQGDIFYTRVGPSGPPAPSMNPATTSGGSGDLDAAFSGSNVLLVWRSNTLSNANNYIVGRLMSSEGAFLGVPFTIAEAAGRQLLPTVTWDGQSFLVAWDDQRNQGAFFDARTNVYAARVSESGAVLDPAGFSLVGGPDAACTPSMVSFGGVTLAATSRFLLQGGFDSYRVGLTRIGTPVCAADFNHSGAVSIQDIFDFLGAYFSGSIAADFNASGVVSVQDVFDFLTAYFTPC